MNISQFERAKPVATMAELNRLINKYTSIAEDKDEVSNENISLNVHFVTSRLSKEIQSDLVEFKSIFQTGD